MTTLSFVEQFADNLHIVWTFLLLVMRYSGFMFVIPGIGEGIRGLTVRYPAILVFAFASMRPSAYAEIPPDGVVLAAMMACEFLFGMVLGAIPLFIVAGVQMAGQLASTSMGLGAGQLFDPSIGGMQSDLGRLLGDLTIVFFLLLGGHHVVVMAASGLGGQIIAGSFIPTEFTAELLINRTSQIFRMAVMISAPVIVALLLTQFVMGLISKAVPSVNIFIVSFPLTIAIGLLLTIVSLPEVITFVRREFTGIETSVLAVTEEAKFSQ
ncbi:MAG: flagellar biosynthetic protein FliR [Deltaproteobacteria bacterium]|nr:flagellar biosynthetic protein FliR [Deltaproteobacteria bacterium]